MRRLIVTSLVLTMAAIAPAMASELVLGGSLGVAIPTGDLGDAFDAGGAVRAFGEYYFTEQTAARVEFGYGELEGDDWSDFYGYDATFSSLYVLASVVQRFGDMSSFHPYVTGGVGFYNSEIEVDGYGYSVTDDETDLGIAGGGGARLALGDGGFGLDFEVKGHYIFFEDDAEMVWTAMGGVYLGL